MWLIWLWFASLTGIPCLTVPSLRVADLGPLAGSYNALTHTITVEPWVPRYVVIHELAHHYSHACQVPEKAVGRRFLQLTGRPPVFRWGPVVEEEWAATFAWALTGRRAWNTQQRAGPLFERLIRSTP